MIAIENSLPAFCSSDKTVSANSFHNQPQIYFACLATYNNGGSHRILINTILICLALSRRGL